MQHREFPKSANIAAVLTCLLAITAFVADSRQTDAQTGQPGGVTKYEFRLGTTGPGSNNVYNSADASTTALTTWTVSVPTTGGTLNARLYSRIYGVP
jgi:hypothetical protein